MNTNNLPHSSLHVDAPSAGNNSQLSGSLFYTPAGLSRFVETLVQGSAGRGYNPTGGTGSLFTATERTVNTAASASGIFTP